MKLLLLPKEVENLIGEFNVEHRPKMREVMDELSYYYKYFQCYNCDNYSRRIDPETVIIYSYCERFYCSMDCCYDDRWL
jgi:hypothetical protein